MTDRSRRAAPSESADSAVSTGGADDSGGAPREENPFAAPPEGSPDRPWQPRHLSHAPHGGGGAGGRGGESPDGGDGEGTGEGSGSGDRGGRRGGEDSGSGSEERPSDGEQHPAWGSQWSSRQPGRHNGGFGASGGGPGEGGPGGDGLGGPGRPPGGAPPTGSGGRGMRWDPTDPLQRHARYALHAGVWSLFFALFSLPEVALLLSALSLYWGIHALGAKNRDEQGDASGRRGRTGNGVRATAEDVAGSDRKGRGEPEGGPDPSPFGGSNATGGAPDAGGPGRAGADSPIPVAVSPEQAAKSKRNAAITGLVLAAVSLAVVASTFAFQMVYKDYFSCTQDALTQPSRAECTRLLPPELRPFLQNR